MVSMVLQLFQEKMEEILQEMIEEAKAAQAAVEIKDMESGEKIISPQSYKFLAMFLTEAQQAKLEEAIKEKAEAASQTHIETVNKSTRTGMDVVTPNWKLMKISGFDELEFQSEVRNSSK